MPAHADPPNSTSPIPTPSAGTLAHDAGAAYVTHAGSAPLVLFLLGMTLRRPHRIDQWLPVVRAMPKMLAELHADRTPILADGTPAETGNGFLGGHTLVGARGPVVQQYWRSTEDLHRYARSAEHEHLPAWREFNRRSREHPGTVGIWHETYDVPGDRIESIYGHGARVGLVRILGAIPVTARGRTARQRLGSSEP